MIVVYSQTDMNDITLVVKLQQEKPNISTLDSLQENNRALRQGHIREMTPGNKNIATFAYVDCNIVRLHGVHADRERAIYINYYIYSKFNDD